MDTKIRIIFVDIETELSEHCEDDYLEILSDNQDAYKRVCGNKKDGRFILLGGDTETKSFSMKDIIINNNNVELRFVSDSKLSLAGFKIMYEIALPEPIDCIWSDYFLVTPCSKNCGGGTQIKIRRRSQVAKFGGQECPGSSYNLTAPCNQHPCCKCLE